MRPQGSSKQGEVHPVECEKHDCFIVLVRPSIIFSLFGEALPGSDMSRSDHHCARAVKLRLESSL